MAKPIGFSHVKRKNGVVEVFHHGRQAAVLRGRAAERFAGKLGTGDEQKLMARATGKHRRGNERG